MKTLVFLLILFSIGMTAGYLLKFLGYPFWMNIIIISIGCVIGYGIIAKVAIFIIAYIREMIVYKKEKNLLAMPINYGWETGISTDEITGKIIKGVHSVHIEELGPPITEGIGLSVYCDGDIGISGLNVVLGNEYSSKPSNLLVRFDEHDAFNVRVVRFGNENFIYLISDESKYRFAKGLRDYNFLYMKIHIWRNTYITARFNLIDFVSTYDSHCG